MTREFSSVPTPDQGRRRAHEKQRSRRGRQSARSHARTAWLSRVHSHADHRVLEGGTRALEGRFHPGLAPSRQNTSQRNPHSTTTQTHQHCGVPPSVARGVLGACGRSRRRPAVRPRIGAADSVLSQGHFATCKEARGASVHPQARRASLRHCAATHATGLVAVRKPPQGQPPASVCHSASAPRATRSPGRSGRLDDCSRTFYRGLSS